MLLNIEQKLVSEIHSLPQSTILIHSDLMRGFDIRFEKFDRTRIVQSHYEKLADLFKDRQLVMPSFSYTFLSDQHSGMDVPSQVGVLAEYFRTQIASWRTPDPVFSFSGTGTCSYEGVLSSGKTIDPFGSSSYFHHLYNNNALLFHYGSAFKHSTIIHYIERKMGTIIYRYDKIFKGRFKAGENVYDLNYLYHVRPKGKHLDYDWDRLIAALTKEGFLKSFEEGRTVISYCDIASMVDFLCHQLSRDPFYLLDAASKEWIIPLYNKLGRKFELQDFE